MPLDPKVQDLLDMMAAAGMPKIGSIPAADYRAVQKLAEAEMPAGPDLHDVTDGVIPATPAGIAIRTYLPSAKPSALIVYYHGGGWTIGSLDGYDATLRKLARETDAAIVSVDYRMAPEHPFPAAVEDAHSALNWASANVEKIAGRQVPLFVAGDSAGGNLSAVVSQLSRDGGGPDIAGQILIYPSTDGDIDADHLSKFESPFLTRDEISWFFDQYVPDRAQRVDPRFAPIRASSFSNLPPALILTAEYDLLCEDGVRYAQCLRDAGVRVELEHFPGTIHGFFSLDGGLDHSLKATKDIAHFIRTVI